MNPAAEPPAPPQPHRSSFSCDRHPDEQFTGFCPSCLCERLTTLDQSSSSTSCSHNKPSSATTSSTAAAAIKAIFRVPGASAENGNKNKSKPSSSSTSFFPELRRTKSFSASKNEGFSGVFEPQRKSCDVRGRNTLWSLFNIDDERKSLKTDHSVEVETRNLGLVSSSVTGPVFESKEEDEDEPDDHKEEEQDEEEEDEDDDEIRACEEPNVANVVEETVEEIVEKDQEEEEEEEEEEEVKRMKDHIDLDSQAKKPSGMDLKEIAGSFWSAASVFSKKWHKWRQKQKLKKRNTGGESAALPVEKPISRQYRETQSEIADYGFGRRSCDTDPRFSLDAARMSFDAARMSFDAARMSFDDPRYSFDEPRASWDGYLIGRTFPRLPPMVSVVEDAPVVHVPRSDTQIPVEEPIYCTNNDETLPGGSAQTRDYYLDSSSSSRRRKSLDRSNSIRKTAEAVVAEIDEMKTVSNAKVTPATLDYCNGTKLLVGDRDGDLRDFKSNSLRDDCSETFELGFRDNASVLENEDRKGVKKSRRWSKPWNIWGLIYRRNGVNKDDEGERYNRANGVQRSLSESWQDRRREGNREGEAKGGFNRKVFRSNSSVSWRNSNSYSNGGPFGSVRKSNADSNGNGIKKRDEFVLERNRSARYSPNNVDNGLLRFYLTPLRGSRRGGSGKSRPNNSHSIARSVLRLY